MKEGHDGFCVRSASLGCGTMSVESVGFHIYLIIKKKKTFGWSSIKSGLMAVVLSY